MNSGLLVIAAGLCLIVPAWIGLFSAGAPTLYSPFPTLTALPALVLSRWHMEAVVVVFPSALFFLWNPGLFVDQTRLPRRTTFLVCFLSALTILDFIFEWKYGVEFRGTRYTVLIYIVNAIWLASIWYNLVRSQLKPSSGGNLLSHWLLFAWLAWFAFPWLGELP